MTNDYALKKIEDIKKYDQEADNIIMSLLPKIATIEKCLPEEDMKLGVDSHICLVSDTIAQRVIENPNIWNAFHSIMLRYSTPFYTYTEYLTEHLLNIIYIDGSMLMESPKHGYFSTSISFD